MLYNSVQENSFKTKYPHINTHNMQFYTNMLLTLHTDTVPYNHLTSSHTIADPHCYLTSRQSIWTSETLDLWHPSQSPDLKPGTVPCNHPISSHNSTKYISGHLEDICELLQLTIVILW